VVAALTILVLAEPGWATRRTQRRPAPMAARDDRPLRRMLATAVGAQLMLCTGSLILWGILPPTTGMLVEITLAIVAVPALIGLSRGATHRTAGEPSQPLAFPRVASEAPTPAERSRRGLRHDVLRASRPAARPDRGVRTGSEVT
jgi:hypothetical protein